MKPEVIKFGSVDSTNAKLRELIRSGKGEGTVVISKTQTGGRGSGKNRWYSGEGGLYLSMSLRPRSVKQAAELSILAGLALCQTVGASLPKQKEVSVKWPNDCLVDWKKVGGVLCETVGGGLCVVGIGLNVNTPAEPLKPFEKNPFSATSMILETGPGGYFELDAISEILIKKLSALHGMYWKEGFSPIKMLWEKNFRLVGKRIELRESGWTQPTSRAHRGMGVTEGVCLGIDDTGALVLANKKGERHNYYSGKISCFWQ